MKKILISCLVLVVVITSLYFFFRETIDRFNPMIAEEYVYVEVQGDPSDDDGRYKYNLKGINESNETKRVVFSTSTRLDQGTFVRVLAKGTHTIEYTLINRDEMPSS
ncbi:YxeA family protein [Alkalicoccobacillus murimartini]|uniref:Uncharacterized protein (TIGR01655 family) n=1 Tax=Alkalicoccobacillus murimartini TaxID=171685 RepID=A0ABT9YJB8_9BACI|nr:YxeA family protein [Alkalicoccobacillus murimartini]MDQ0207297.1 uncharacterized protein (TIGR01655 family) [Alkalicoccobacillus murimartini]